MSTAEGSTTPAVDERPIDEIVARFRTEVGELPPHLALLAEVAPSSLQGHDRMWREVMRDPSQGGAMPRRYKALLCTSIAMASRNGDAAEWWARVGARWGLTLEELLEVIGFNITGQGMSTFRDIGQRCVRAAREQIASGEVESDLEPMPPVDVPASWADAALPQGEQPPGEHPALEPPTGDAMPAIHAYFERSFNAPMPEFWAALGRESAGLLEGYYLLRRYTMRRPEDGGHTPKIVKELNAVVTDTVINNPWGGEAHLRAAMVNGATLAQVREAEGLVIMEAGMVVYKLAGYDFVRSAQQISAILKGLT
jgi:alkylhydroperoxidase/carboxymuconolactone decarboxylase family protein YurZ